MRDPEAKLGLLDFIEAKPAFSVEEITESLHFGIPAMAFARSSSGNKLFIVEEVGYNLKRHLKSKRKILT